MLSKMMNNLALKETPGATIERIGAQDRDKLQLGIAAFMWISHSEGQLRSDNFCHTLGVKLGSMELNLLKSLQCPHG